jgi:hypothetical protein
VRNKTHLVAQGFSQVEGLNFGVTFAPVACLEVIRIFVSLCYVQEIQTLLNGREKCLPKWCHTGGGLC